MKLVGCITYLAAIGILSHFIGEALPRSWFHSDRPPYETRSWEHSGAVYERLGIRAWKDKLPDMSRLCPRMIPKRINSLQSYGQIDRLIQETCVAEMVHIALIIAGLACLLIWKGWGGIVVFGIYLLGNLPFIWIQRYNRPRLEKLCGLIHVKIDPTDRTERNDTHAGLDFKLQHR